MRFFITLASMPVPDRVRQACQNTERNIILPYAAATFGFWQISKYFGNDSNLGAIGVLVILHLAPIHMAGRKNVRAIASVAGVSLSIAVLSLYLLDDALAFGLIALGVATVILLGSNLRRRQVVRDFSPKFRNWPG